MTVVISVKARNGAVLIADAHPMKKIEGGVFPAIMSSDQVRKSGAYIAWSGPFRDGSFLDYFRTDICNSINEARNLTHPRALGLTGESLAEDDPVEIAGSLIKFLGMLRLHTTI